MGSTHLKAVAVKGKRKTTMADPGAIKVLLGDVREQMNVGTAALKKYGTTILVNIINKFGGLGVRNLQTEVYDKANAISGETFKEAYFEKDTTCFKCPVACGKDFNVQEGEYAGTKWKMPEYETIFALGSMLDNSNKGSIVKANELCDQLGMDTISLGVTLAFAFECFEPITAPGIDPLGPENMIVFAVGPLTDTLVPGATRCCAGTKSPLTGLFFDSTFGGMFAVNQKRAGFEAIIITGRAPDPVCDHIPSLT